MINKLGDYIFKRIQKDNSDFRNIRYKPRESMTGLYISSKDIQRYVNEYLNYGMDYMGDDNISADDKMEHYLEGFLEGNWQIDPYWDEAEGKEE